MFFLVILILLSSSFAQLPSVKGALNDAMFEMLKEVALKEFNKNSTNIRIEDFETDISVAKIIAKNITMSIEPIKKDDLGIHLIEGTNNFVISGRSLSMNGSLNLTIKVGFIKIDSYGVMSAKKLGFNSTIKLLKNGTRLAVNVTEVNIDLLQENISIKLSGNIISSILNAVVKFLKAFFFENIKGACQDFFPEVISGAANTILSSLPDEVPVTQGSSAKFMFVEPPKILKGYAIVPILAYVHKDGDKDLPPYNPPAIPDLDPDCHKGIQIFVSDYVIKTTVDTATKIGLLSYNKTINILGFKTDISCKANSPPIVKFDNYINFKGSVLCNSTIHVSKNVDVKLDLLITLNATIGEVIRNSTLYLNVKTLVIEDLKIIIGDIFDLKKLINELNKYLKDVIDYINIALENKGIPLPNIDYFDISDVNEGIKGPNIFICGNLKPKNTTFKFHFPSDYYYKPKIPHTYTN